MARLITKFMKKPYTEILKHLRKNGVGKRVEILSLLNENLKDAKSVETMINSLADDGLIRYDRNVDIDGELKRISVEITKEGIEHLDRVNIYLFSKIAIGISVISLIIAIATYLK